MNDEARKIEAGEKEIVLASEEVQRRNAQTAMAHSNLTRKMLLELNAIVDALQNKMIAQNKLILQQRNQLAALQQQFYAKGTVSLNE